MTVIDSDKTAVDTLVKLVVGVLLIPFISMVCAGTLAHHHPDMFNWIFKFSYWDWVLAYIALGGMIRGARVGKWYVKEEK